MSKKTKLEKFEENLRLPNVFENYSFHNPALYKSLYEQIDFKGRWKQEYFKNNNLICLELACGGGEYCVGLSEMYPQKNFIGVDIKGARIWKGAKKAFSLNRSNVAFIRTKIELITHFFEKSEVNEIWITFPDPFLKDSKSKRRLTSKHYLNIYKSVIADGTILHLKTDDEKLYRFSLEQIRSDPDFRIQYANPDIYSKELDFPELELKTYYEQKHLESGKTIKYIRFQYK